MSSWFQEIRCTAHMLARQPGFTLAAVVTLALGIGANVGIFAFVRQRTLDSPIRQGMYVPQA